jgi:hypothetical protein
MNEPMKTKNLDECDEIKFLFAPAGYRCKLPLSKTSPFADISKSIPEIEDEEILLN